MFCNNLIFFIIVSSRLVNNTYDFRSVYMYTVWWAVLEVDLSVTVQVGKVPSIVPCDTRVVQSLDRTEMLLVVTQFT